MHTHTKIQPEVNHKQKKTLSRGKKGQIMDYHFELFRAKNARNKVYFWWRIRSRNYKILLTSETYTQKNSCLKVMRKLMRSIGASKCDYQFIDKL